MMSPRTRKIIFWSVGMALVGAFLRAKGSYAMTWYESLRDIWPAILIGGGIGAVLGYGFSRNMPNVSK